MCVTIAAEAYTLVSLVPWIAESSFSVVNVVGWVLRVSIVHWDAVTGFVATPFAATMTAGYLCAPMVVDGFAPAILCLSGTVCVFCRGGFVMLEPIGKFGLVIVLLVIVRLAADVFIS